MHWVPGFNYKSDLNRAQAGRLGRALRDHALNLAVAGFLVGVGGVKLAAKLVAEIFGGLGELGSLALSKLSNRVFDAIEDAGRGQRICVHVGIRAPTILGIPALPSPFAKADLTAWPRHGRKC
jgi:hypothetical protein